MSTEKRHVSRSSSIVVADDEFMSWDETADADDSDQFGFLHDDESTVCDDEMPDFDQLKLICNAFETGVNMTRRKHYVWHKGGAGFTGSDAVSFLVDSGHATSRERALAIGRRMAYEFALFRHETYDHDLEDEKGVFYVFTPPDQRAAGDPPGEASPRDHATLHAIADAFEEGVVLGPNAYKNRKFQNTFVGSNAVTFLVSSRMAKTRQDAVRIGQLIMEKHGLFQHVGRKHKFKDKRCEIYQFTPRKRRVVEGRVDNGRGAVPIEETAQNFIEVVKPGNTFAGATAVDAMVAVGLASSRSEAVLLGEKLISDFQLFHCVQDRERAFFDRRDVYYEYQQGHKTASSLQWMDNKAMRKGQRARDRLKYLEEKPDIFMGGKDSNGNQLPITRLGANNNEDYMARCGLTFRISEEICDEEHRLDYGDSSNQDSTSNNVEELLKESPLIGARYFDKFGFILENEGDECDKSVISYDDTVETRDRQWSIKEWRVLLDSFAQEESEELSHASQNKLKQMMRHGLPDSLRRRAWTVITGVDAILQERGGDYQSLVETATLFMDDDSNSLKDEGQSLKGVIERDLHRTFPRHSLFYNRNNGKATGIPAPSDGIIDSNSAEAIPDGLMRLRRVLYAYSIYDNEVGYCQGMNFLAAMFLTFLSEEESFWLLVAVMNEEPYSMRDLFAEDMAGVHEILYVAEKIFRKFLPKLHKHMENEDVNISMFATQWIMTVFTSTFPFDLVSLVWDSYIVEGWKVVYRVVLSLLEHAQQDLFELDLEDILTYLRDEFPSKIDGPSIVRRSLKIPLRHRHIRKYTNEWRAVHHGHQHVRPSIRSESVESGGARSRTPMRQLIGLHNSKGKHISKKLPMGLSLRSDF